MGWIDKCFFVAILMMNYRSLIINQILFAKKKQEGENKKEKHKIVLKFFQEQPGY